MKKIRNKILVGFIAFMCVTNVSAKSFSAAEINDLSEFAPGAYDIVYIFGKHAYFNRITIADVVAAANTLDGDTDAILYYKDGANNWKNAISNEIVNTTNLNFDLSKITSENIGDLSDLKNSSEFVSEEGNSLNFALNGSKLKFMSARAVDTTNVLDSALKYNLAAINVDSAENQIYIEEKTPLINASAPIGNGNYTALLIDLNKNVDSNIKVEVVDQISEFNTSYYLSDINFNVTDYEAKENEFILWLDNSRLTSGNIRFTEYNDDSDIVGITYFNYNYVAKELIDSFERDVKEDIVSTTDGVGITCLNDGSIYKYILYQDMGVGDSQYYGLKINGTDYVFDSINDKFIVPIYSITNEEQKMVISTTDGLKTLNINDNGTYKTLFFADNEITTITYVIDNVDYMLEYDGNDWINKTILYSKVSETDDLLTPITEGVNITKTVVDENLYGYTQYRYLFVSDSEVQEIAYTTNSEKYILVKDELYWYDYKVLHEVVDDVYTNYTTSDSSIVVIVTVENGNYVSNFVAIGSDALGFVYENEGIVTAVAKSPLDDSFAEVDIMYTYKSNKKEEIMLDVNSYLLSSELLINGEYTYYIYSQPEVGDAWGYAINISGQDYLFNQDIVEATYTIVLETAADIVGTSNVDWTVANYSDGTYHYVFVAKDGVNQFTYKDGNNDYIVVKDDSGNWSVETAFYTIVETDPLDINATSNGLKILEIMIDNDESVEYRYLLYSDTDLTAFTYECSSLGYVLTNENNVWVSNAISYQINSVTEKNITVVTDNVNLVITTSNDGFTEYNFVVKDNSLMGFVYLDDGEIKLVSRGEVSPFMETDPLIVIDADDSLVATPTTEYLYVEEVYLNGVYKYVFFSQLDVGDANYYTIKMGNNHYIIDVLANDYFAPMVTIDSSIIREMTPITDTLGILRADNPDGTYTYLFYTTEQLFEFEYIDNGVTYVAKLVDDVWEISEQQ